ncbi:MAG TPA: PaaI family thioesterase [Rhizomicrobium sp.]|jgi:1,4-dihydroxy-2-naphthoyl-CoA hydrolase|nr:PaaI family thioesterase [Rhizomicrobium sp.]
MANDEAWVARLNGVNQDKLPGLIGMVVTHAELGLMRARMAVTPALVAPIGFLFAPSIVALADTLCAYGTVLPPGAANFTTAELKCNFMSTLREGAVLCEAKLLHGGRTTQVWDATITAEGTAKLMAAFRCTQIILWPK